MIRIFLQFFTATAAVSNRKLDVSNPANLTELGKTVVLPQTISGVAVSGLYVYFAAGKAGLRVIDVSNLAAPPEVGFYWQDKLVASTFTSTQTFTPQG